MTIGGNLLIRRRDSRRSILFPVRRHIVLTEILFVGGFALFLFAHSFQPEIFWGEKPMDFTFLNFFTRLDEIPPLDPWAAGQPMHYYYFGNYLMALLVKTTGVHPGVGRGFRFRGAAKEDADRSQGPLP